MKTAISIPDPLFEVGERFAEENGLSRSELYARALKLYMRARMESAVTSSLNEIYKDEPSKMDPVWVHAQLRAVGKEDW